jgi:hypothetical protein
MTPVAIKGVPIAAKFDIRSLEFARDISNFDRLEGL